MHAKQLFLIVSLFISIGIVYTVVDKAYAKQDFPTDKFKSFLNSEETPEAVENLDYSDEILSFYEDYEYKPVWFSKNGYKIQDAEKLEQLMQKHAEMNGLPPSAYSLQSALQSQPEDNNALFARELKLTDAVMDYLHDVQDGRVSPDAFDEKIFVLNKEQNLPADMMQVAMSSDLNQTLLRLVPPQEEYAQMRDRLQHYRNIMQGGGWPDVSPDNQDIIVNPGESHEIVPAIRERLSAAYHDFDGELSSDRWIDEARWVVEENVEGVEEEVEQARDMAEQKAEETNEQKQAEGGNQNPELVYDGELARKVAEFQYFHGRKADGIIGPETLEAMNVPAEQRVNQIKLAMERWRWLPDDLGNKHVRLNIAAFYARAVENGQDEFVMPIIVGEVAHQTPIFSSHIKNVKLHPDWTAPSSIAERYVIPKIQNDPSVINSLGYEIENRSTGETLPWSQVNVSALDRIDLNQYQFRQRPGKDNALGMARFSIENDYAIFMHGTPSKNLFNKDNRLFSSGCIRVQDPFKMAHYLLRDQGMTQSELEKLYNIADGVTPETNYLDLDNNVPVHLIYATAWMDQTGNIHFSEDPYDRDQKLLEELNRTAGEEV